METIVLPSSFLPCIPSHNAMKSKLPSDKAGRSGVWKRRGEDCERASEVRSPGVHVHLEVNLVAGAACYPISARQTLSLPPRGQEIV